MQDILEVYFEGIKEYWEDKFIDIAKRDNEQIERMRIKKLSITKMRQDIPQLAAKLYSYLMYFSYNFSLIELQFL